MAEAPDVHPVAEATDLERRVLAHERILQSLVSFLSRQDPRLLVHLTETFVEPMERARREQDFTQTDDYAEEFIRAVPVLGPGQASAGTAASAVTGPASEEASMAWKPVNTPDRVTTSERNGVWSVTVDGVFRGDYHQRAHAEAAAALARMTST